MSVVDPDTQVETRRTGNEVWIAVAVDVRGAKAYDAFGRGKLLRMCAVRGVNGQSGTVCADINPIADSVAIEIRMN
jgi:hypothetical protein